jgi:hypothetical protein
MPYKSLAHLNYADDMNKQQAQVDAAREVLYQLIKESPYTFKWVAAQVGERNDTLSTRLRHGNRRGYQTLDTALVVNILAVLEVPLTDFFTQVERRAEEILRTQS